MRTSIEKIDDSYRAQQTLKHEEGSSTSSSRYSQLFKAVILAASSIGIGWLISRLWRGRDVHEQKDQSLDDKAIIPYHQSAKYPLLTDSDPELFSNGNGSFQNPSEQSSFFHKLGIVYRSTLDESSPTTLSAFVPSLTCASGLALGGLASVISSNPWPLFLGSTPCLSPAAAESTIPDSVFMQQRIYDSSVGVGKGVIRVLCVGIGAIAGIEAGPAGMVGGALLGQGLAESLEGIVGLGTPRDFVGDAIRRRISEIRQNPARNTDLVFNPLRERMQVASDLLNDLADTRLEEVKHQIPFVKAYLTQTQEMFDAQAKSNEAFTATLNTVGAKVGSLQSTTDTLSSQVHKLGDMYTDVSKRLGAFAVQLDHVGKGVQATQSSLRNLATATQDAFSHVDAQLSAIKINQQEMGLLTKHLVREAMIISTQGFESHKKIMSLEKQLLQLQEKDDLPGAMGKVVELKKEIQLEQQKRIQFDQTLQGIESGIGIISLIAQATGNSKFAQKISTVGHAGITIAKAVGALSGLGTAAAGATTGLAILGPIGAIAGAVFSIFSLFLDPGKSSDQVIIEAVQELSKNLHQVRKEMHERFDHVEKILIEHHKYTGIRFDRLEEMLGTLHQQMHKRFDDFLEVTLSFHKSSITQFIALKDDTSTIRTMAQTIQTKLTNVEHKIDAKFQQIYSKPFDILRSNALHYHQFFPSQTMPEETRIQYFLDFFTWATDGVTKPIVTTTTTKDCNLATVAKAVSEHGIPFSIQSLADLTYTHLGLKGRDVLPNPLLWENAVDTLLEFIWRTPEFEIKAAHKEAFEKIRSVGLRFQNFVVALQTSPQVYQNLIKTHKTNLNKLQEEFSNLVLQTIKRGNTPLTLQQIKGLVGGQPPPLPPLQSGAPAQSEKSAAKAYFDAQQTLKTCSKIDPHLRQIVEVDARVKKLLKDQPEMDSMYQFLLLHLSLEERGTLLATLRSELAKPASRLNLVIEEIGQSHVLLEAFVHLGFESEFYYNYEFRQLFERLLSSNNILSSILSWDVAKPEEMPFIRIVDRGLPFLEDFQNGMMDKISEYMVLRSQKPFTSLQNSGYSTVDKAQQDLHLFEMVFLGKTPQSEGLDSSQKDDL